MNQVRAFSPGPGPENDMLFEDLDFDFNAQNQLAGQARSVFAKYDANGNGLIDQDEAANMLREMGISEVISDNQMRDMFDEHDANYSGELDFDEVCPPRLLPPLPPGPGRPAPAPPLALPLARPCQRQR